MKVRLIRGQRAPSLASMRRRQARPRRAPRAEPRRAPQSPGKHLDAIADGELTRFDHPHVDAAQVAMPEIFLRYEPERVVAEARVELLTPAVRQRRHFEDDGSRTYARS